MQTGNAAPEKYRPVLKIADELLDRRNFAVTKTVRQAVLGRTDDLETFENFAAIEQMNVQNCASGDFACQLFVAFMDVSLRQFFRVHRFFFCLPLRCSHQWA